MPTLHNHTHCQVAQKAKRTEQSFVKELANLSPNNRLSGRF